MSKFMGDWRINLAADSKLGLAIVSGVREQPDLLSQRLRDPSWCADLIATVATHPSESREELRAALANNPDARSAAVGALLGALEAIAGNDGQICASLRILRTALCAQAVTAVPRTASLLQT